MFVVTKILEEIPTSLKTISYDQFIKQLQTNSAELLELTTDKWLFHSSAHICYDIYRT